MFFDSISDTNDSRITVTTSESTIGEVGFVGVGFVIGETNHPTTHIPS